MNTARPKARIRLQGYRALVAGALPVRNIAADTAGLHLEADGIDPVEPETICTIPHTCPADNRELIRRHVEIVADLIHMVDEAMKLLNAKIKEVEAQKKALEHKTGRPAKDYAAECAMKCTEMAFQQYLAERHDLKLPTDKDKTATRVKFVLRLESRKDLNTDPDAAARWRALVKDFEAWRRRR